MAHSYRRSHSSDWYYPAPGCLFVHDGRPGLVAVFLFLLIRGSSTRINNSLHGEFDATRLPVAAAGFIADSELNGNSYAPDHFGGYLIYRFYPKMKVFIDGRSDFYRTGEVLNDYLRLRSASPEWASLLDKYEVGWMLVGADETLATLAESTGKWMCIYRDGTAQVLVRKEASR